MRTTVILALGMAVLAGPARGGDREAALAVIDQAVRAHGGEAALARAAACSRTEMGEATQGGQPVTFRSEVSRRLPDEVRLTMLLDGKLRIVTILNGKRGWQQTPGGVSDLPRERIKELRDEAYVWWLATLVPLRKDTFTLARLPDARADGKPAFVVRVTAEGRPEARLFFNKDSGLLVRIERKATEAGLAVNKEYAFADFKDFDGARLPAREVMSINGKKWTEVTISSYKLVDPGPAAFQRP